MKFVLNKPVETREPSVLVDGTLKAGINRFRLEVFDEAGNRSKPTEVDILVTRTITPDIVRDPVIVRPITPDPIVINPTPIIRRPRT